MDYLRRLHLLQKKLKPFDGMLVEDPIDLYYLTGLDLSAGKLLVLQQSPGTRLFVDGRYTEISRKKCPYEVSEITPTSKFEQILFKEFSFLKRIVFDSRKTSYQAFQSLQKNLEGMELVPLESPLESLRNIKDGDEIKRLKEAAALGTAGFERVCSLLKEGISEEEVAAELEIFWKRRGGKHVAFDPIIAFGANSSMPHYRASASRLKTGQHVLIDIGVEREHYHSDMTRVVFFGSPDPRLLKIYDVVKKAQQAALNLCRPGTSLGALDAAARDLITAEGYGPHFTHSLGHGIGLDVHEFPTIKNSPPVDAFLLTPGMVITIEPGIYLQEIGGIRIEDTVLITENGFENFSSPNKEVKIICN